MHEVFKYSEKGKRQVNEDYLLIQELPNGVSLYLLADGMGGYQYGDIASSLSCITIAKYLSSKMAMDDVDRSIIQAVEAANNAISQERKALLKKLGTTIAGALVVGTQAYFFWLGDVRIYHVRNHEILFQSEDHSLVNELKKQGGVSSLDTLRYRNIVTRSIMGDSFQEKIPVIESQLLSGDTLLLCTDGLWQNWNVSSFAKLPEDELLNLLSINESTNEDNYSILRLQI